MKRFWYAVGGGALGLVVFAAVFCVLCILGWDRAALAMMALVILIGACTGLIYSKLREMHDDLCTTFAQQEKISAIVERLNKNVLEPKNQAADEKEPPADGE